MPMTADDVRDLADRFLALSRKVKEYRLAHADELSDADAAALKAAESKLRDCCSDATTDAVGLGLAETTKALEQLQKSISEAQRVITTINNVKKVINVTAAAVQLATAIGTENPAAVSGAVNNLLTQATA